MPTEPVEQRVRVGFAPGRNRVLGHCIPLMRRRLDFFESLRALGDIVEIGLGPRSAYVLTEPKLIRRVLVDDAAAFHRGGMFKEGRRLVPQSISVLDGEEHRSRRRLLQPVFQRLRMAGHVATVRRVVEERMSTWRPGRTVVMEHEVSRMVIASLTEVMFSASLSAQAMADVCRYLPILSEGVIVRSLLPSVLTAAPTPGNLRYRTATARVHRLIQREISLHRSGVTGGNTLLSLLLSAHSGNADQPFTDQQVRDELFSFLLVASETTPGVCSWIFHELATHPHVAASVEAELDRTVGEAPVDSTHLPLLEYTGNVVHETSRLYAGSVFMREAIDEVDMGGFLLRPGDQVLYSPYAVHRDPRVYSDPTRFDPDRWSTARSGAITRHSFFPFGAGVHRCIGEPLALMTMTTVVATVCAKWRFTPVSDYHPHTRVTIGVRPEGVELVCTPRSVRSLPTPPK
jgi:cytochrome P450